MYLNKNLGILAIVFLFFVSQYATVWMNEELLLVISFVLFYALAFSQLRHSMNEFFLTRRNEFVDNPLVYLKTLALNDLKAQKENQYANVLNLFSFVKTSLQQNYDLLKSSELEVNKIKNQIFNQKCIQVLKFEDLYNNKYMNALNSMILQNTFKTDKKTYLNNQIRVYSNSLKNKTEVAKNMSLKTKLKIKKQNKKK